MVAGVPLYSLHLRCAKIYAPFQGSSPRLFMGDVAEVFLDPVGDFRQWYEVEISPRGGLLEKNWMMTNALEVDQDNALTPAAMRGLRRTARSR